MNDNLQEDENKDEKEQNEITNKNCFYIAAACFAMACVLFALSFIIKNAGVYTLFGSLLFSLAALSFLNGQKKRGYFPACKVLRILCYAVMGTAVVVVIAGIIVSTSANS